jgi:MYXO-CTERM domain-containing protein
VRQWTDLDGDGYGNPARWVTTCPGTPGRVDNSLDCDDTRADVHPSAAEVCDGGGTDEDCDGLLDDADPSVDPSTFAAVYPDVDGDGFGDASAEPGACEAPAGYVSDNTDCDDGDAGVHPAAEEVPGDGVDQDCDGVDPSEAPSDDAPAKSGCSTAPASPLPWLAALLALPALARRRRG